ncbi:MAG: hypothetical protein ACRD4G_08875 [Bryobacteraceae bacterium]
MERLEFLSGKYKEGERIVPGAVQTFQATEADGGRPVFVHRIPTTGAEAQNGIVRLLSAALLRSEGVRKLVVEVADEDGFCYVVTQNAEQCLLLREWLQLELDGAGGKAPADQAAAAERTTAPPVPPQPEAPVGSAPGEFSRLFHVPPGAQPAPPAPSPAPPSPPNRSETGEFTRFFRSGAPPAKKPPEAPRQMDRASSSEGIKIPRSSGGAVQRPAHAPATALPQRPSDSGEIRRVTRTETGEFTRLFSTPAGSPGASPFPPPAAPNTPFNAMPSPAAAQEPGEYTRIFGTGNSAPPLAQPGPPAPGPPPARPELFEAGALSAGESLPRGPSEYTRIIGRGSWNQPEPPQTEAAATAPPAEAPPAAPAMPAAPPIPAVKPPAMPKPAVPKVAVPKGAAAAAAMAPAAANKRLVIFLVIIGLLAVILAIAVILLAKK